MRLLKFLLEIRSQYTDRAGVEIFIDLELVCC